MIIKSSTYFQTLLREMEQKRLPRTPMMMENASFVMQGDTIQAWPLLCDPTSRVIPWVKSFLSDKGLVEVKYSVSLNFTELLLQSPITFSNIKH